MIIRCRHCASENFIRYKLQKNDETPEVLNGGLVMVFHINNMLKNKTSLIFLNAL